MKIDISPDTNPGLPKGAFLARNKSIGKLCIVTPDAVKSDCYVALIIEGDTGTLGVGDRWTGIDKADLLLRFAPLPGDTVVSMKNEY